MTDTKSIFVFNDNQDRVNLVKAMHQIVVSLNDETPYWHDWVDIVPDEPSEEDLTLIAEDDDALDYLIETFAYIVRRYVK